STMANSNTSYEALYVTGSSSNTITRSYISNTPGESAYLYSGSNFNTISLSTITSNGGNYPALNLQSSSNSVAQSYINNPAGEGLYIFGNGNLISSDTITSGVTWTGG